MNFSVDKNGYLTNISDWNQDIARAIAQQDNLTLTDDHWHVINFLHNFYLQYNAMPTMRVLVKELTKQMDEKKGNSIYLNSLFPQGLMRQASKLAGLPKPTRCI
jgi:tRNA 2-thiouridine synthesizing protein E